jgi:heme/copper-type cytochrome/quinol oxidase subunit 1
MSASPAPARPRIVEVAFWVLIAGAVVLIVGGLLAATTSYDTARAAISAQVSDERLRGYLTFYRGIGVGSVLAGAALAFVAGRARTGHPKFRRATIALSMAIVVVLVLLAAGAGVGHPVILVSIVPIVIGTMLITRRTASAWYRDRA